MKLRTKWWLLVVSVLALALAASAGVVQAGLEARSTLRRVQTLDGVLRRVSDLQGITGSYGERASARGREQWMQVYGSLVSRLETGLAGEVGGGEELERLEENAASLAQLFGALIELDEQAGQTPTEAQERLRSVLLSQITITLQTMVDDGSRWESRAYRRMGRDFSRLALFTVGLAVILLVGLGSAGLTMKRSVLRPLKRLEEGIHRIAGGDRSFRFGWDRNDEIGAVTRAFDSLIARLEVQTERRERTERRLRKSEERFRQIAEHIDDVFWATTPGKDTMEYVSSSYERIWGRPRQDLYDDPRQWLEMIHPDDRERVRAALPEQPEGTYEEEYRIVRPDGEVRWIWDRAFPVRGEEGEVFRIVGVAEDVTGRRELEQQLRQSQKMEAVGRLAGGIAHDFNNLLTVIQSQADLLEIDADLSDDTEAEIEVIRRAADRAANLTGQLLAFSRKQVLQPRVVDLNAVVRDMDQLLRRVLGEDVRVETDLREPLPPVRVDPSQMEHVLLNLAVNAREAMPGGGTLTLSTSVEEADYGSEGAAREEAGADRVGLEVADDGVGMDAETQAQIFEPFFTTKEESGGTGLGLATVYGIVEQSGGSIEVESEPGEGTTFTVRFPVVEGEVEAPSGEEAPDRQDLAEVTGRILVVEDDSHVRSVARRILEQRGGLKVRVAGDAETGLEILAEEGDAVDLVLTDLVLPGMGGRELMERLRERRPDLPVVVMSGYAEGSPGSRVDLPPEIGFLEKPFSTEALLKIVVERLAGGPSNG